MQTFCRPDRGRVFSIACVLFPFLSLAGPPSYEMHYPVGARARSLTLGDFTGDGWPDIAVACNYYLKANVSLLASRGDGRYAEAAACIRWADVFDLAPGDFDGDGKLDLAVSSSPAAGQPAPVPRAVRIFFGDGRGDFPRSTEAFDLPHASDPTWPTSEARLIAVDVTGDGRMDVVAYPDRYGKPIPVFTLVGNGRGNFAALTSEVSNPGTVYRVLPADLNEDGFLDLAVLGSGTGKGVIQIVLGRGDGTFVESPESIAPGAALAQSFTLSDLDGDGHLDIACSIYNSNRLAVHYGKGKGKFEVPAMLDTPAKPIWVQAGDWDSDGRPDLYACAVGLSPATGVLFPNLGGRRFGPAGYYVDHHQVLNGVAADVDLDGVQDLVTVCNDDQVAVTLGGMPCGLAGVRYAAAERQPVFAGTADVNHDGFTDLVLLSQSPAPSLFVMTSRGDGSLRGEPPMDLPAESDPSSVTCADLNGDGNQDAVVADSKNGASIFLGDGTGFLSPAGTFGEGIAASRAAIGRLDGDPHPDLVLAGSTTNSVHALPGNGDGTFGEPKIFPVVSQSENLPGYLSLADVDGDGRLDCLVAVRGNRPAAILPGDGQGGFGVKRVVPGLPLGLSSNGGELDAADLDGDGRMDIVELDPGRDRVHIWRSLGGWTFADSLDVTPGNGPIGLVITDMDLDGDLDIACGVQGPDPGTTSSPAVAVLRNAGDGSFPAIDHSLRVWRMEQIVAGEFDGNGSPDLISREGLSIYTLLNAALPGEIAVTAVEPAAGPRAGGTAVTIRGRGFSEGMRVLFGERPATQVRRIDSRTLEAVSPSAEREGYVAIRVGPATLPNGFLYRDRRGISEVVPDWAPLAGGVQVEVRGEGFDTSGTVAVFLGRLRAQVVSAAATKILVTTPKASTEGTVSVLVRDAAGEVVLASGFFFGEKRSPAVGTVAIVPVDGGRKITWSNPGTYDSIVVTRADGETFVLDGDATELLDTSGGALTSDSYTVAGQTAGLVDSSVQIANPSESTCPWLFAEGSTREPSESWIPLRPGVIYGARISVPPTTEDGLAYNRLVLSVLVRRNALWGELVASVYRVVEADDLQDNRFPLVADGIVLPVAGVPGEFSWVERTVELSQEAQPPCNLGSWYLQTGRPYFFCLSTRLRPGEEDHESDRAAPFALLTATSFQAIDGGTASGFEPTFEVYIESVRCGIPHNVLPVSGCNPAAIVPVQAPDPMIRILPLSVKVPRLRIEKVEPREIGLAPPSGGPATPGRRDPPPLQRAFEFTPVLEEDFSSLPFGGGLVPDVLEWTWDFGDGTQQVTAAGGVVHSYDDGVFRLSVTARASSCERSLPLSHTLRIDTSRPGDQIIVTEMGPIQGEFRDALIVGVEVKTDGGPCSGPGPFHPLVYQTTHTGGGQTVESVTFEVDIDGDGQPESTVPWEEKYGDPSGDCLWQARLIPGGWSWPALLATANESTGKVSARAVVTGGQNPPQPPPQERPVTFRLPPKIVRSDWSHKDLRESPEAWVDGSREYHFKVRFPNLLDWSEPLDLWVITLDNEAKAYAEFQLDRRKLSGSTYRWFAKAGALCELTLLDYDVIKEGFSKAWSFPDATGTPECLSLATSLGKPAGSILCMPLGPMNLYSSGKITLVPKIEVPIVSLGVGDISIYGKVYGSITVDGDLLIGFSAEEADLDFGSIDGFRASLVPRGAIGIEIGGSLDLLIVEVSAGVRGEGGLSLPIEFVGGFDGNPFPSSGSIDIRACWDFDFDLVGEVCVGIWIFKKCWGGSVDLYEWSSCGDGGASRGPAGGGGEAADVILSGPAVAAGDGRVIQVLVRNVGQVGGEIVSELFWSSREDDGDWGPELPVLAVGNGHPKVNPAVAWVSGPQGSPGRAVAVWTEIPLAAEALGALQDSGDAEAILSATEVFASSWNSATSTWSAPARLTNDSAADGMATVCADAEPGKARIAWVRVSNPGGPLLSGDSVIRTSRIDAATLQVAGSFADLGAGNDRIERKPLLVSGPATVALGWIQDEDRSLRTRADRLVQLAFPDASGSLVLAPGGGVRVPGADQLTGMFGKDEQGEDVFVWSLVASAVLDGARSFSNPAIESLLRTCPLDGRQPCQPEGGIHIGTWHPGQDMDWLNGWFASRNRVEAGEVFDWSELAGLGRLEGVRGGMGYLLGGSAQILNVDRGLVTIAFSYQGIGRTSDVDGEAALVTVDASTGNSLGPVAVFTRDVLPDGNMAAVMDGLGNMDILLSHALSGVGGGGEAPRNVIRPYIGPDLEVGLRASDPYPDPGRLVDLEVTLRSVGLEPVPDGSFVAVVERLAAAGFWIPIGTVPLAGSFAPAALPVRGSITSRPLGGRERIRARVEPVPAERTIANNSAEAWIGLEAAGGLACAQLFGSVTPEVEVRWAADAPGASVRILRDGAGVAVVPAASGRWIDEGVSPGPHAWQVLVEYQGCLSPPVTCALEVAGIRLALRVDPIEVEAGGVGAATLVRADLAPDTAMRGFSLGVAQEAPLVLVAAETDGTLSEDAQFADVRLVGGGAVATVVFGQDPGKWLEGRDLPVLRLVYSAPAIDPSGSSVLKRRIEILGSLGDPSVPVRLLAATGLWEPAAREEGIATISAGGAEIPFLRGDANADGEHNITDAIFILGFMFLGSSAPPCMKAADVNGDGDVNITDPVHFLGFLYLGGDEPKPPYPSCGTEPAPGTALPCEAYSPENC